MRPGVFGGVLGYPWVSLGVLGYPGVIRPTLLKSQVLLNYHAPIAQ